MINDLEKNDDKQECNENNKIESCVNEQRCYYDGFPFTGTPFRYIIDFDINTEKPIWDIKIFCHFACVKRYLRSDISINPNLLNWLQTYIDSLGLKEPVPCAPDKVVMKYYNASGKGLTIEEFRNFFISFKLTVVQERLHISQQIWIAQPQENKGSSFGEIILENAKLHKTLFKRIREDDNHEEPIPKALLDDEEKKNFLAWSDDDEKNMTQPRENLKRKKTINKPKKKYYIPKKQRVQQQQNIV